MGLGFSRGKPTVIRAASVPGLDGVVSFRPWTVREFEEMATERKKVFEKPGRTEAEATAFLLSELAKILLDESGARIPHGTAEGLLKSMELEAPTLAYLWDFALFHCGMAKPPEEIEKN